MSDVQKAKEFIATSVGQAEALAAQEVAKAKTWMQKWGWTLYIAAFVVGALVGRFVL